MPDLTRFVPVVPAHIIQQLGNSFHHSEALFCFVFFCFLSCASRAGSAIARPHCRGSAAGGFKEGSFFFSLSHCFFHLFFISMRAQFALRPTRDGPSFCVAVVRVLFGLGEGSA